MQIQIIDSLTLTDSFSKVMSYVRDIADNIAFSDNQIKGLHKTITDILTINDSITLASVYYRTFADSVSLTDSQSKTLSEIL